MRHLFSTPQYNDNDRFRGSACRMWRTAHAQEIAERAGVEKEEDIWLAADNYLQATIGATVSDKLCEAIIRW